MKEEWPRLVVQKNMKHIKYDVNRCIIPDDDEKKKPFLTFGKEFDESLLEPEDKEIFVGSDVDYSISDVMSSSSD